MDSDTRSEHDETWFGSGLRAHLGIKPELEESAPAPEAEPEDGAEPRVTVPPLPPAPDLDELLARVAERERGVREAEERLAERERALEAEAAELQRERERLEARAAELDAAPEAGVPVRNALRDRAERESERLWRTIDDALEASFEDGRADFHARLAAIKLLLGEAYDDQPAADARPGTPSTATSSPPAAPSASSSERPEPAMSGARHWT
jgi:hypothetical protein